MRFFTIISIIFFIIISFCSCDRQFQNKIDLPDTPLIISKHSYGVIRESYVRVKKEQNEDSEDVGFLKMNDIGVISQHSFETVKSSNSIIEWYHITTETVEGWVQGKYLETYDSIGKAQEAIQNEE